MFVVAAAGCGAVISGGRNCDVFIVINLASSCRLKYADTQVLEHGAAWGAALNSGRERLTAVRSCLMAANKSTTLIDQRLITAQSYAYKGTHGCRFDHSRCAITR